MNSKNYIIILTILLVYSGCSNLKKDLPEPTSPLIIHSAGWNNPDDANFHGKYLKQEGWKTNGCTQCHSSDFSGGTSNVSCYNCHNAYPHRAGWDEKQSGEFHGLYLKKNSWNLRHCQTCHGNQYNGMEITDKSCMTANCHVDKTQNPKSPEACNTCHGEFIEREFIVTSWAPPQSVDGILDSTNRGVGAHQKHLSTGNIGKSVKCSECHNVPSQVFASGHLDTNLPAEVVMNDTLAQLITGNGTLVPDPKYDSQNLTCTNTYCHGNWKLRKATSTNQFAYTDSIMVGANYSPVWVVGTSAAQCGSCHGLPPSGHITATISTCGNCHTGVVNNTGVIIDKTKHINGKINVFGQEKLMN